MMRLSEVYQTALKVQHPITSNADTTKQTHSDYNPRIPILHTMAAIKNKILGVKFLNIGGVLYISSTTV
jgi:hypothetical protein